LDNIEKGLKDSLKLVKDKIGRLRRLEETLEGLLLDEAVEVVSDNRIKEAFEGKPKKVYGKKVYKRSPSNGGHWPVIVKVLEKEYPRFLSNRQIADIANIAASTVAYYTMTHYRLGDLAKGPGGRGWMLKVLTGRGDQEGSS
jgi:hypothetical protein